jgi:hypothetical protein
MTQPTSSPYRKKLIEVALPLEAINKESAREKSIHHGTPQPFISGGQDAHSRPVVPSSSPPWLMILPPGRSYFPPKRSRSRSDNEFSGLLKNWSSGKIQTIPAFS